MGKTCAVPRCRSGYKGVDMTNITMHTFRDWWKDKIHRDGDWMPSKNHGICSEHFVETDFVEESEDKNYSREKGVLKKRYLKPDAIPSIFSNCPRYLNKTQSNPRNTKLSSAESRKFEIEVRAKKRELELKEADTVSSLDAIVEKVSKSKETNEVFQRFTILKNKDHLAIYKPGIDSSLKMTIICSLVITPDLSFQCHRLNVRVSSCKFESIGIKNRKIKLFSDVLKILDSLESTAEFFEEDTAYLIDKLKTIDCSNLEMKHKLEFITEQLELLFMHRQHRRYSADLLSMCVLWENTSTALYNQVRDEGVLTLPSLRYIKKLTSALSMDTGLSEQTIKYLKARFEKLDEREKVGSLIIDEVYVAQKSEYTRSDGRIYGLEEGSSTKTLLTIMLKSVASDYEDVIAMVPLTKIDSGKIDDLFQLVLKTVHDIGFHVVATLVDGHSSNVKFYKDELCEGVLKNHFIHPLDDSKKIFLLFDATHIFKCIYNNFQTRKVFSCPPFEDKTIEPNFKHIVELYELERVKPIKMAFLLNDACLNPQPIEKTKVSLASHIFSESTRNAFQFYVNNGFGNWEGTLNFLNLISKWWDILNVKTPNKGHHKRNPTLDKVNQSNYENISNFFSKLLSWIEKWKSSGKSGLSNPTFKSFSQTTQTMPLLVKYLLEDFHIDYVLTGKIQSDFLEKRFGRYRQLCGANYFATERQFLEAEKAIRVKSLIKFANYSIKDVQRVMSKHGSNDVDLIKSHTEFLMDCISENLEKEVEISDANIIFYVAGFITKSLSKKIKCNNCKEILGNQNDIIIPLIENIPDESCAFLEMINRGGLIKPNEIVNLSCIKAWELYSAIMENDDSKNYFVACKSQREVFTKCFEVYLNQNEESLAISNIKCSMKHSFCVILKNISEKFFNMMASNFVREINSLNHSNKKRSSSKGINSASSKIRKLQSSY